MPVIWVVSLFCISNTVYGSREPWERPAIAVME
jgi:hypothetical protein